MGVEPRQCPNAILVELASVVGNTQDKSKYTKLYQDLAPEFHSAFYNSAIHGYADGKQTANALALWLDGVTPPSVRPQVLHESL